MSQPPATESLSQPLAPTTATLPSSPSLIGWSLSILIAAVAAWYLYNYLPFEEEMPADLAEITDPNYAPADIQQRYSETLASVTRNNCDYRYAFTGLCLGAISALFIPRSKIWRWIIALVIGSLGGVGAGMLASHVGLLLSRYFGEGGTLPFFSDAIAGEVAIFVVVSMIVCAPVALSYLVGAAAKNFQVAIVVFLAALLTGLLVPIVGSLVGGMQPEQFPIRSLALSGIWFGILGFFTATLPMVATGSRRRRSSNQADPATPPPETA